MITYRWKEPGAYYGENLGRRLGEALDSAWHWPSQLAANLAMASLLCKAAMGSPWIIDGEVAP